MHTVGVRELKNRVTYYLKIAKKGDKILVTDRGVPVAVLHSPDQLEMAEGIEERLVSLAGVGLLTLPKTKTPWPQFQRVQTKGLPVSETIIRERK